MTLDRVITIQRPIIFTSPSGQQIDGYEDVGLFHAALDPAQKGSEKLIDFTEVSQTSNRWVIRYGIEAKGGYRVKHGSDTYLVRATSETKAKGTTGRGRYLTLFCDYLDGTI